MTIGRTGPMERMLVFLTFSAAALPLEADLYRVQSGPTADKVKVLLNHDRRPKPGKIYGGLRTVEFCIGCPDPHLEGSQIKALGSYHGVDNYSVTGELTMAVPNTGCAGSGGRDQSGAAKILNAEQLAGRVVFVDRGGVPLVEKVLAAQNAGAVGVLIADDGNCTGHYECGRAGSPRDGGFSKRDPWQNWRDVDVPAMLIMKAEADRLRAMMRLERKTIPGFGEQWIDIHIQ